VALFSGGVDSFVGAAVLLEQGRTPTLVTHSTGSAIPTATKFLRSQLLASGALGSSIPISAHVRDGSNLTTENSQRARSLLFLGSAALVAQATGLRDIFINENGVMAIHTPVTAARIGSFSTRTASPALLENFAHLASAALDSQLSVQNLLQRNTKPEVVERATKLGKGTALAQTVSCWSIGRTRRHCGFCAPCLMRRISFELHDVTDALYDMNPFHGVGDNPAAKDNLVHLIMFARDLIEFDDAEIELEYPEVLNVGPTMTRQESLQLHRRWADQVSLMAQRHPFTARLL
jgi:7-cyano-7-deazaguanine synthase in queuosine biosynthesis